jgi:hypothetical protein
VRDGVSVFNIVGGGVSGDVGGGCCRVEVALLVLYIILDLVCTPERCE